MNKVRNLRGKGMYFIILKIRNSKYEVRIYVQRAWNLYKEKYITKHLSYVAWRICMHDSSE